MGNTPDLTPIIPQQEPEPSVPSIPRRNGLVHWLKQTQKYSAYGIVTFAGLHLTSTFILPAISVPAANSAFMAARDVYQSALGEQILVYGAFGAHILSGLTLRAIRIFRQYRDYGRLNLGKPSSTAISGMALAVLVICHFGALRWAPVSALGDSSLMSLDYIVYLLSCNHKTQTAQTAGILSILLLVFTNHMMEGGSYYFKFIRRWWKSELRKNLTISAVLVWAAVSMFQLSKQEAAQGWLADQFELVHNAFPKFPW